MRRTRSRWSSIMRRAAARAPRSRPRAAPRRSALMFRVSAALELFEVGVAFVLQFVVDADLGGVITVDSHVFDRLEEPLLRSLRLGLVLADLGEDGDLLVFGRLVERV